LASLALLAALADAAVPSVTNLHSTAQTLNTVTLAWDLSPPSPQPILYTLLTDGLLNQFYPGDDNIHVVNNLEPCRTYHFELKPTFEEGDGLSDETTTTTEYMTPEGTSDLTYDEASNTLTWTAPSNAMCVDHYKVCWRSLVTMEDFCTESTEPSLSLDMISGCEKVRMTVNAIAPNGKEGPEESLEFDTAYGDPGAPVNFTVKSLPNFAAALYWDLPEENPACIREDNLVYGQKGEEETVRLTFTQTFNPQLRWDNEALVANLSACTDYEFELNFISVQDVYSDVARDSMTTDYIPPNPIEEVTFVTNETAMNVMWADNLTESNCLDHLKICYQDTVTHERKCIDAYNADTDKSVVIDGLSPCRTYEVVVSAVSITGEFTPATQHEVKMKDTAPGPVTNLAVDQVSYNSLHVSYDPPTERPECVFGYVVSHKQEFFPDKTALQRAREGRNATAAETAGYSTRQGSIQEEIDGLYSCSHYRVEVYAKSASNEAGLRQQEWAKTLDEAPFAPTDLETQTRSTSAITTSWFAPENRFCVKWYKIRADTDSLQGEEVVLNEDSFSMERMHTLSDLQACTPHTVVVEAGNDIGSAVDSYQESTLCP